MADKIQTPLYKRDRDCLAAQVTRLEAKLEAVKEWERRHHLGLPARLQASLNRILQGGD